MHDTKSTCSMSLPEIGTPSVLKFVDVGRCSKTSYTCPAEIDTDANRVPDGCRPNQPQTIDGKKIMNQQIKATSSNDFKKGDIIDLATNAG